MKLYELLGCLRQTQLISIYDDGECEWYGIFEAEHCPKELKNKTIVKIGTYIPGINDDESALFINVRER